MFRLGCGVIGVFKSFQTCWRVGIMRSLLDFTAAVALFLFRVIYLVVDWVIIVLSFRMEFWFY